MNEINLIPLHKIDGLVTHFNTMAFDAKMLGNYKLANYFNQIQKFYLQILVRTTLTNHFLLN